MSKRNIFFGEDKYSKFVNIIYQQFVKGGWVTYSDIMHEYYVNYNSEKRNEKQITSDDDLPYSISNCDGYGELKKAFPDVCRAIRNAIGSDDCIVQDGNRRNRRYRYVGENRDPLRPLRMAKAIDDIHKYWEFCQDSAGFLPSVWLDYFLKDSMDLFEINSKEQQGERILDSSIERVLTNIEWLPFLYESIKNHWVLNVVYKPFGKDEMNFTFHPQYMREYNGRWHLFGHAEGYEPEWTFDIAIDRLKQRPQRNHTSEYKAAPKGYYKTVFENRLGVSKTKDSEPVDIHIRAHGKSMFLLMETKKLHKSQKTVVPFGTYEDGEYGEFVVHVEVNNEFVGAVLQMGSGLEVVSPSDIRQKFMERVDDIYHLYHDGENCKQ